MSQIFVLDQHTINKIAAGEVIERPSSVIKELVENAIDAGSSAITVEIKDGGISFIRVTDNGIGISSDDISKAFLRHSTSKIKSVEDLVTVTSLGFRGEALSSIAAVAQVELITKTKSSLTGSRYVIEGGDEKNVEEIGCPEGTTFVIRNLFYNTPARRKFLKSPSTEASHISELMDKLSLSHPHISFKFINNNQNKLHTSGNNQLKDIIYNVYGRDIANNLLHIQASNEYISLEGYIGKPVISRGNRNYESFFINGRYIKSSLIQKAVEEGYKTYLPIHKYPFAAIHFTIDSAQIDVNVHPTKMELRFKDSEEIFRTIVNSIQTTLLGKELIPNINIVPTSEEKTTLIKDIPEPFEKKRIELASHNNIKEVNEDKLNYNYVSPIINENSKSEISRPIIDNTDKTIDSSNEKSNISTPKYEQVEIFENKLLAKESKDKHRIIGQLFNTYWLVQFEEKLYIIDQHAAHERVMYDRLMNSIELEDMPSQRVEPPMIVTLSLKETEVLNNYSSMFEHLGFEIEHFGNKDYAVRAVPNNLYGISQRELFIEMIDSLVEETHSDKYEIILEKIAKVACKAAVKANNKMSNKEAESLIDQLLSLDNPYTCPHGRPTIISMSQYELEKKFKRIQ